MLKQFTIEAGAVIHIQGLPFYLVHDTTFEGRPANIAMVSEPDVDTPNVSVWLANIKRPWWKRLIGIR